MASLLREKSDIAEQGDKAYALLSDLGYLSTPRATATMGTENFYLLGDTSRRIVWQQWDVQTLTLERFHGKNFGWNREARKDLADFVDNSLPPIYTGHIPACLRATAQKLQPSAAKKKAVAEMKLSDPWRFFDKASGINRQDRHLYNALKNNWHYRLAEPESSVGEQVLYDCSKNVWRRARVLPPIVDDAILIFEERKFRSPSSRPEWIPIHRTTASRFAGNEYPDSLALDAIASSPVQVGDPDYRRTLIEKVVGAARHFFFPAPL